MTLLFINIILVLGAISFIAVAIWFSLPFKAQLYVPYGIISICFLIHIYLKRKLREKKEIK